jgi:hypothetical protein
MESLMRLLPSLLAVGALWAQEPAPLGVVRGVLVDCDSSQPGQLSIRAPDNRVFRFAFDLRTWFEREHRRTSPGGLNRGEQLEIVSDRGPSADVRYARMVQVMDERRRQSIRRAASLGRFAAVRDPLENMFPRGELTFSGVVSRMNGELLTLRTRIDGEKLIYLRSDTRYIESGEVVEAGELQPHTRVFVRASRNLDNDLEAFQVIWGEILEPSR